VDSDDEWEDEPEGESIASSAGDEDEEVPEEDDDDGFFVPHGHLSDDELDEDDRQVFI
jgi:chromatin assembly factor 1 subunit A